MSIKRPEGTHDLIEEDSRQWSSFQKCAASIFEKANYKRIETPIFEKEELFVRGIGQATDVVNKEMFSVLSGGNLEKLKANQNISSNSKFALRPEGTAGVVRAAIENNLIEPDSQPTRLWYAGEMFRAERPQKGRQRQFMQVGLECLGSSDALLDAQAISLMMQLFKSFGIDLDKCTLHLNSMGCDKCRPAFRDAVASFLTTHKNDICERCNERASLNPLRAFDCKNEKCKEIMKDAPKIDEFLCQDCKAHFEEVKNLLFLANIKFEIDLSLVRGLDYYTRTVFECTYDDGLGAQNAIGGGGRYDHLVQELGGKDVPGLGFAVGFERCLLAKQSSKTQEQNKKRNGVFIIALCESAKQFANKLIMLDHFSPLSVDLDFRNRLNLQPKEETKPFGSLKSQLRLSDKLNSKIVCIIGEDEMEARCANIKFLETHDEEKLSFDILEDKEKLKKYLSDRGVL